MKTYFYAFADGYFCYTKGKMDKTELKWETTKHGKLVTMKVIENEEEDADACERESLAYTGQWW